MSDDIDTSYVSELMQNIVEDNTVPRNIRSTIQEAKDKIEKFEENDETLDIAVTSAIYLLDDISNDINMPTHTRTEIWTIISELESIREQTKKE